MFLAVGWLFKGQQQCCTAASGWSEPSGPVCVRAQCQTRQGRHLLADRSDRPSLLETQLPHLGEWHTQPHPLPPATNGQVNTFMFTRMFTVCGVPITQSTFACLMMKRGFVLQPHSFSSCSIQHGLWLFFSHARCATSVTQSSRITTPSITAVPAGRASVMAALPKLHPSPREAGVLPLSECVTSALSRDLHMQVHTL